MQYPHRWIRYDLEIPVTVNATSTAVVVAEKRQVISVCERVLQAVTACVFLANGIITLCNSIATGLKDLSDQHSCGTFTGSFQDISYKYTVSEYLIK